MPMVLLNPSALYLVMWTKGSQEGWEEEEGKKEEEAREQRERMAF